MRDSLALLTDLYELTMAASYFDRGMNRTATFDLFVRRLPKERNFLVASGLELALEYLSDFRFDEDSLDYLDSLDMFSEEFLSYLSGVRFTGDVWAIREGEVAFGEEPLVSLNGPLIEVQLAESFLLNCISSNTMVASKAARIALASRGKAFVDFSLRRDHGGDAGMQAARASYIAGAAATSNVLAAKRYGIPPSGTMAHSYIMAFGDEEESFRAFAEDFPDRAVLLIDTYDVEEGARKAARVAVEMREQGNRVRAVRIDSGDLAVLTPSVRKILDEAGLEDVEIFLSGDLDEYRIDDLMSEGVPADGFGVGTQLGTSGDAPSLGSAYKLVAYEGRPAIKLSTDKITLPCPKQVFRFEEGATATHDVIAMREERLDGATPLLERVMKGGRRIHKESLHDMRERCAERLARLPESLKSLQPADDPYEVRLSEKLGSLIEQLKAR